MDERYGSGVVGFLGTWTQGLKGPWRNARGQNRDLLAGRGQGGSPGKPRLGLVSMCHREMASRSGYF